MTFECTEHRSQGGSVKLGLRTITFDFSATLAPITLLKKLSEPVPTVEKSEDFVKYATAYNAASSSKRDEIARTLIEKQPALKKYHYLFVGGIGTGYYPTYFASNKKALDRLKLPYTQSAMNTLETAATNGAFLAKEVAELFKKEKKKIVVIAQSKGGVDVSVMLSLLSAEEQNKMIGGLVLLQTAMYGTPVLTLFTKIHDQLINALFGVVKGLKGNEQSLRDLDVTVRREFMKKHPIPTDRIPTLSFVSYHDFQIKELRDVGNTALALVGLSIQVITGEQNDGLVPQVAGIAPGSVLARVSGLDHTGACLVRSNCSACVRCVAAHLIRFNCYAMRAVVCTNRYADVCSLRSPANHFSLTSRAFEFTLATPTPFRCAQAMPWNRFDPESVTYGSLRVLAENRKL